MTSGDILSGSRRRAWITPADTARLPVFSFCQILCSGFFLTIHQTDQLFRVHPSRLFQHRRKPRSCNGSLLLFIIPAGTGLRIRTGAHGTITQHLYHRLSGLFCIPEHLTGAAVTVTGTDAGPTGHGQTVHHVKPGRCQIMHRPDGGLTCPRRAAVRQSISYPPSRWPDARPHPPFTASPSPLFTTFLYSSSIAACVHLLRSEKSIIRFCHVLAVQLRLVESHIRLQHTVGDHVVQAWIGTLYHHRRQTGNGAGRPPESHPPIRFFKAFSHAVKLITHRGLQVKVAAHQIAAPAQVHTQLLHVAARGRL